MTRARDIPQRTTVVFLQWTFFRKYTTEAREVKRLGPSAATTYCRQGQGAGVDCVLHRCHRRDAEAGRAAGFSLPLWAPSPLASARHRAIVSAGAFFSSTSPLPRRVALSALRLARKKASVPIRPTCCPFVPAPDRFVSFLVLGLLQKNSGPIASTCRSAIGRLPLSIPRFHKGFFHP